MTSIRKASLTPLTGSVKTPRKSPRKSSGKTSDTSTRQGLLVEEVPVTLPLLTEGAVGEVYDSTRDGTKKFQTPLEVLSTVFGYSEFRPGQLEVIEALLAGRDCVALMPTGAGKSITFQIPAKILKGPVLVLSPLISLMKDQVDGLVRNGFKACMLNSSIPWEERQILHARIRKGDFELVYVAPEALEGGLRTFLAECNFSLVAVDEAHCIDAYGFSFRPAYRNLKDIKSQFGNVPVLALTATATNSTVLTIMRELGMKKPFGYKGSFYRPNLHITTQKKGTGRNTRADILALIRAHKDESAIIYCQSRKSVDELAAWLKLQGVKVLPYHAGLDAATRTRNQDAFSRDKVDVIVATISFAMGIDKSNVRLILHKDLPKSTDGYYQEIGRAGRDSLASECVLMYSWADVIAHDYFLESIEDLTLRKETREKTIALFRMVDSAKCRHQALVACFGEEIEPCGSSCDVCKKVNLSDRLGAVKAAKGTSKGSSARGALTTYQNDVPLQREDQVVANPELFERLRALRRKLADAENVPAYIVFNDAVLRAMSEKKPKNRSGMLSISGIGPTKFERYGKAFLDAIKNAD